MTFFINLDLHLLEIVKKICYEQAMKQIGGNWIRSLEEMAMEEEEKWVFTMFIVEAYVQILSGSDETGAVKESNAAATWKKDLTPT